MKRILFILVLLLTSTITRAQESGQIVAGDARFTVITPNLIRIETRNPGGQFVDDRSMFAANRDARFNRYSLARDGDFSVIDTGPIRMRFASAAREMKDLHLSAQVKKGDAWVSWKPGDDAKQRNLGGTIRTLDGVSGPVDPGLGLLSRDGWYLLDDSKSPLLTRDWVRARPADAGIDSYFFGYGADYRAALKSLAEISGAVPLPRKYMLGVWYSRYWPYTADDFRQIVKDYSDHGFPLDVIVMDMDWHVTKSPDVKLPPGDQIWTGYTWDKNLIPDPKGLLDWFHQQGLHVTLNDHPADGVQTHESMYADFMRTMGDDPESKEQIPFDSGNQEYLDTFWNDTHKPLLEMGVDFWWLDWQQSPFTRSVPTLSNLAWLNQYYFEHQQSDALRGASFSRWAGWGDQRHPIHFSGDADTGWKMLAFEVPFTSTAGNVGCFFWSHDIGGHMGGRNEESYARWCQFGATSAALRSHSTRDATMDRRPSAYPKWAEDSMRVSFQLRSKLFPYIYTSAAQSCREMVPLTRPMYFDYPDDEQAYRNPQEYLLGDNVLVSPIASPGIGPNKLATQIVWFPPRSAWYNLFTGEKYSSDSQGTEQLVAADIDEFPLYVRAGVPIPMQPFVQRPGTASLDTLVIRAYPADNGALSVSSFYEDDGTSRDYSLISPRVATTQLKFANTFDGETMSIDRAAGQYDGQLPTRNLVFEFANTSPARKATVDGNEAPVEYDEQDATNRVRVKDWPIDKPCEVHVECDAIDPATCATMALARRTSAAKDPALIDAAIGARLVAKNESPCGYPDAPTLYLYAPAERITGRVQWSLIEQTGDGQRNTLASVGQPASAKMPAPDFGHRPAPRDWHSRVFVQAQIDLKLADGVATANRTFSREVPLLEASFDLAMHAKVVASSNESGYSAAGAIDGVADGYPHGRQHEWSSGTRTLGATLTLTWNQPQTIDRIWLYDRPNLTDQVTSATIAFDDGSKEVVGELPNDGAAPAELKFAPKTIRSLTVTITGVRPSTENAGISEIAVFGKE